MTDHVDGNALAGPLTQLFAIDLTAATAICAGCGRTDVLAAGTVYGAPMGLVLRCVGCGDALLRCVEIPGAVTLDLRGIVVLRVPTTESG